MRRYSLFFAAAVLLLAMTSCKSSASDSTDPQQTNPIDPQDNLTVSDAMKDNADDHESSGDYVWTGVNVTTITLNGNAIVVDGTGVTVNGCIATITSGGDYLVSGTLNDGRIIVDSGDNIIVRLKLNDVDITSTANAPISVLNAEKTVILLADGTQNYVTDPSTYVVSIPGDEESNAAIYSKDDLSISGNGTLTIDANYNDGIASTDGLVINGGTINIDAADDGIRGKDYLVVKAGAINIQAGGDGLKSDNYEDVHKGYILIESGDIDITCDADGFDAETDALIMGGTFDVTTGGGSGVPPGSISAKGIKGGQLVVIDDGTFTINASDDAIHSNTGLVLNTGVYTIATGDDAVHADDSLVIEDGSINITKCVEGIESCVITVNGGTIRVAASDDAVNSTAGADVEHNDGSCFYINGGYIVLTATNGDGVDSNGNIEMTDGTVIIHGPPHDPEVFCDYNGTFKLSGGFVVASGSGSHMTESPSASSTQNSLTMMFHSAVGASTIFHLEDSEGNDIVTFQPVHQYQSIMFSSPELVLGKTYTVYRGGTSTGVNTDGVYSSGTYSGGTPYTNFTVSGVLTVLW